MKPYVIVGGGLSGLAAAVGISSRNLPVLLLEQKRILGGRAFSLREPVTGESIDNGQHLLIAGYRRTLRFLETIGSDHLLSIQRRPEIVFYHPVRGFKALRLPRFPSPLHLAVGLLSCDLFEPVDRWKILRAGIVDSVRCGSKGTLAGMTVSEWLDATGQSYEARRSFWEPLAVSIMNETAEVASAEAFRRAVREAFLGHWKNASLVVPRVGLSDLFVYPAADFVRKRGGEVRCNADVTELVTDKTAITFVRTKDGSRIDPEAVVLAVPSSKVAALLPEPLSRNGDLRDLSATPVSPIITVYLWYERDIMPHDHVGVIGKTVQWFFNRGRMYDQGSRYGGHVSAVISAARDLVNFGDEELARLAVEDLVALYGQEARKVLHKVVLKEKRATISLTPGVEVRRPQPVTAIRNLFLAGDWTATGYPATIEGAVASGERCADLAVALREKVIGSEHET
ncbi:MAG: hydroxysqualene dehydroxylase HpnE [Bacteroidota bacterium]